MTTPRDAFSRMTPEQIEGSLTQIDRISQHIRTNWFALIGLFAFAGVTLLSVKDADFFAFGRETTLPLIGISIPTKSFFWVAPPLIAAIYIYFHLSLLKLWDALATAPPRPKGRRLGEAIFPTLISDFALSLRPDRAVPPRALRWITNAIVVTLVWLTIPGVLIYFWRRSMPAHDLGMTLFIGLCVAVSVLVGLVSAVVAVVRLREPKLELERLPRFLVSELTVVGTFIFAILCGTSFEATKGNLLVPADMFGEQLVPRPGHWRDHATARREFRRDWCKAVDLRPESCWSLSGQRMSEFSEEWRSERSAVVAALDSLDLSGVDLRFAGLQDSFLVGADVQASDLRDALLQRANLEGARLDRADMEAADLEGAHLEEVSFEGATLDRAILVGAKMTGANFIEARLEGAHLLDSELAGALLIEAKMDGANLARANLEGANLMEVTLVRANLWDANLDRVDLWEGDLRDANLWRASLSGADLGKANLEGVIFLTQRQLLATIGDWRTILPADAKTGRALFIQDPSMHRTEHWWTLYMGYR